MPYKFTWKLHATKKDQAIGICKQLPDSHCHCFIQKMPNGKYWVALPTMLVDVNTKKLVLRDKETARDFANDFLAENLVTILRYQISQMKNAYNYKSQMPLRYYEDLLQKTIEEELKKSNTRRAA